MKRRLTKEELLAQLAEKERRIQGHLEAMKEEGTAAAQALEERATEAGEELADLADQARDLLPLVLGGGLALWLAGRTVLGLLRRRRPPLRLSHDELVFLAGTMAQRMVQAPLAVPAAAVEPPAPVRSGRAGQILGLLAAAAVGAALGAMPWERLLGGRKSPATAPQAASLAEARERRGLRA